MEVKVKDRQTLLDISIQCLGGIEGVFALAERNDISITDRLKDGAVLTWEVEDTINSNVQKVYATRGLSPATDIEEADMRLLLRAISDIDYYPMQPHYPIWPGTDGHVDKLDEILGTLQQGNSYTPTSDLSLTRIFDNPFDIVFA